MEQKIINIINDKAKSQLGKLSKTKQTSYRAMVYAGVRVTLDEATLKDVAEELSYSIGGVAKLVNKWNVKVISGDVTIHRIVVAYNNLMNKKHRSPKTITINDVDGKVIVSDDESDRKEIYQKGKQATNAHKPKGKWVLGFFITPEEEMHERAAIRSAILFMQKYGKGREPRMNGEYYTPGDNPEEQKAIKESEWLPLETAARYCGCNESVIEKAAQNEDITRRIYKKSKSRNYYEYLVSDLDNFIVRNGLV